MAKIFQAIVVLVTVGEFDFRLNGGVVVAWLAGGIWFLVFLGTAFHVFLCFFVKRSLSLANGRFLGKCPNIRYLAE